MDVALALGIAVGLGFALTNGLHDAANAIAGLVATRAATPGRAVLMASVFNVLGPLLLGSAVASTVAGIVTVSPSQVLVVVGAALTAATAWNLVTWRRGLPSSSGHALVGGLAGAALAESGPDAVRWGGLDGWRPVGVLGTLIYLAAAPVVGALLGVGLARAARWAFARATRGAAGPVRVGQWTMSAALAASHGANDAQKAIGLVTAMLVGEGRLTTQTAPLWVTLSSACALTAGTALGGWRIVRTIGQRLYRLKPLDALTSETVSSGVILAASGLGAPVSTTQVVAASVVGVAGGAHRWRHVRWTVARRIAMAWVVTIPVTGLLAAAFLPLWRVLG
jgi:PiT family inorganic phosphate transporter